MKIGIDVRAAVQESAGIGKLTLNLVTHLIELDHDHEYYLFSDGPFDLRKSYEHVHPVITAFGGTSIGKVAWHACVAVDARYRRRLDRFLSFGSLQVAALTRGFTVLIIPDLSHILLPEFHVTKSRVIGRTLMRLALTNARRIVAISEHTRKDILHYMKGKIDEEKIAVAHIACEDIFRQKPSPEDVRRVAARYDLHRKYILFVGTLEPRKNIPALIKAFGEIARLGYPHDLVIAGKTGWHADAIFDEAKSSNVESRIRFIGFVPLNDMPSLYTQADVFVYPSLYEGFGIPPLEAMSCGVPVITSSLTSLPEVTGDAAILIDPHSVGELTHQLARLLGDQALRERYSRAGLERARIFSWGSFAEKVLTALVQ